MAIKGNTKFSLMSSAPFVELLATIRTRMSSDDLFEACKKGNIARVRQAVADGVDVTKVVDKRRSDFTLLHYACQYVNA